MAEFIFPFRAPPSDNYHTPPRAFGARRSGGERKHAGCDLYAPEGTEIMAMADGIVIKGPYDFYRGTYALEVKHDNGMVIRYGEIKQRLPRGIQSGARVSQGQIIGYVAKIGRLHPMLHLEMYQGTGNGRLTQSGNIYRRRADLVNPTSYLDAAPFIDDIELEGKQGKVNSHVTRGLNVRREALTTADVVFTLSPGATCRVLEEVIGGSYPPDNQNKWYKVQRGGQKGFAAAYYLNVEEIPVITDTEKGRVNHHVATVLNVRSQPSTSSTILFELSPRSTCQVLEEVIGGPYPPGNQTKWYRIKHGRQEGFAAAYYIDLETNGEQPPSVEDTVEGRVNHRVTTVLNVRSQASTSSTIEFTLSPGNVFKVLEQVSGDTYEFGRTDWLKVEYNGQQGFAAAYYVNINEESKPVTRWERALPDVPTTGASAQTAGQDNLLPGIQASRQMAETDLSRVKAIADTFCTAASKFGVPAAVLAAIASRESRCGNVLLNGWGDNGNAFGVMQVDKRYHQPEGLTEPTSLEHIEQATGILASYLEEVEKKHPDWEDPFILKGAAVAYNSGVSNVRTKTGMDIGTTGNDYGSDVMARAQYYANHSQLSVFRAER